MAKEENKELNAITPNEAAGITVAYFKEQGAKSRKLIAEGKPEGVVVNLYNTTNVRFTRDFGYNKEGDELLVSDVAYAIYDKAGVIEKV